MQILVSMAWVAFWTYWIISARRNQQTKRGESARSRSHLIHLGILLLALLLVATPLLRFAGLGSRFLPDSILFNGIGIVILLIGLGFAIWARIVLGQQWSGQAVIKTGHHLIRTGPYALVRHPIYTGIITGMLGSAVALGEWRGLIAFVALSVSYRWRISVEEGILAQEFGAEYDQYRREVKTLIPFVY